MYICPHNRDTRSFVGGLKAKFAENEVSLDPCVGYLFGIGRTFCTTKYKIKRTLALSIEKSQSTIWKSNWKVSSMIGNSKSCIDSNFLRPGRSAIIIIFIK